MGYPGQVINMRVMIVMMVLLDSADSCSFCVNASGRSVTYDLASLPAGTFDSAPSGSYHEHYHISSPCAVARPDSCMGPLWSPVTQDCRGLGSLDSVLINVSDPTAGFNLTLRDGSNVPPCGPPPGNRTLIFRFVCSRMVNTSNSPDPIVVEHPSCTYTVTWHHPSACTPTFGRAGGCAAAAPPAPPAEPCEFCLPTWKPTWNMYRSTVLYTCNNSGLHDVAHATAFGVVVYDWSNAKALWANAHPMNSEELLTRNAEAVLAADPGVPGEAPRVWVYRNTIKALNWYTSVREKLDDPKYASWFIKFREYRGPQSNSSYHVPACDFFGNASYPPKCSGFYHDQKQTPEHRGGGKSYPVDGECIDQCDCGATNPCGEVRRLPEPPPEPPEPPLLPPLTPSRPPPFTASLLPPVTPSHPLPLTPSHPPIPPTSLLRLPPSPVHRLTRPRPSRSTSLTTGAVSSRAGASAIGSCTST